MLCGGKKRRSKCPVTFALDRFGDKWSLLVVRDLMFRGRETYGEFLESGEGIATNVLADRLKCLETEGLIETIKIFFVFHHAGTTEKIEIVDIGEHNVLL